MSFDIGAIDPIEMWALTAVAALSRLDSPSPLRIDDRAPTRSAQFAFAVGLRDVIENRESHHPGEPGRTVKLARIRRSSPTEQPSGEISRLLIGSSEHEDTRRTIYYVLNELLRNVVQHSRDALGGVVGAQLNRGGRSADRPMVQVAVADTGIGIPESLLPRHPRLTDPQEALDKALWPHISSAFEEGETGSAQNAGMGLFFIAEMTKLVGGRLVIASRGATLVLEGDQDHENPHGHQRFLERGLGFPGTLVAFEMPAEEQQDYEAMIETIRQRAREKTPQRAVHQWLQFESAPPTNAFRAIVRMVKAEDADAALAFSSRELMPRLFKQEPVVLDFSGLATCTQSYVHALLYQPLRLAWAMKVPIHIQNAKPAVRSTLELLENYALGG